MSKIVENKKAVPYGVVFASLFVAFFCSVKTINSYMALGINVDKETSSGPMTLLYLVSVIGAFFSGFLQVKKHNEKIPKVALFILVWLFLFYLYALFFLSSPYTSFTHFGVFTLVSFVIPFYTKIDGRILLKTIMILAIPAFFRQREIFEAAFSNTETITMGLSYAYLTPVVVSIVYMFVYFLHENKLQKVLTLLLFSFNLVFAYYLLSFGSRGPVLAIISLLAFLIIFRCPVQGHGILMRKGSFLLFSVAAVFAFFAFTSIIGSIQKFLGVHGITLNFIDKFVFMEQIGDISNGREILYAITIDNILEKPFFGWGCDQFCHYHDSPYPHNFLLQILYDGGLLLLFILAIPLWKCLKRLWKSCVTDEYAVFVSLLFSGLFGSLFSGDLWASASLWLLFGALLSKSFVLNKSL